MSTIINQENIELYDLSCNRITAKLTDIGSAHIVSIPSGAKIYIDYVGDTGFLTPNTINNIPVGPHAYKLTYPGYTDVNGILFIESGKTYDISLIMEKLIGYFDPTKLFFYTLGTSLIMFYLFQRSKEKRQPLYDHEEIKEEI